LHTLEQQPKDGDSLAKPDCIVRTAGARSLAWIIVILAAAFSTFAAESALEYKVKAGFIYNFVKFVEWPATALGASNSSVVVGVLSDDPAAPVLQQALSGKSVNGRALEVRVLKETAGVGDCHLVFIGRTQEGRVKDVLDQLKEAPVLTVSESDRFCQRGGMINLVRNDDSFRFEINLKAAERASLKISSRLSGQATIVKNVK
jgi:hypothetical protein